MSLDENIQTSAPYLTVVQSDILIPRQEGGSYESYIRELTEKKKRLNHVKESIDHRLGKWSQVVAFVRREPRHSIRELVDEETTLLSDMSDILSAMTTQYGGERERLLTYFQLLGKRLETIHSYKPADLVVPETPTNTASFIKSLTARLDYQFHASMQQQLILAENNTRLYAEEAMRIADQCQRAYATFLGVTTTIQNEHEHLVHVGPALVSAIELGETNRVVGGAMQDVQKTNNNMYLTVHRSYEQLRTSLKTNRAPMLNDKTRKIEFLPPPGRA